MNVAIYTAAVSSLLTLTPAAAQMSAPSPVVQTTLGPIRGLRKTVLSRPVDVFYGIPFAEPPVGELRFKHPQAPEKWKKIRLAIEKPNACFQTVDTAFNRFPGVDMWNPNTPISEDCLYLNVWVPGAGGYGTQRPVATMVWIYGGGFFAGSSALDVYDGARLASSRNVIVASFNYRVGPLGFLFTGTPDAPGNQGLMDQVMALQWLRDNLLAFGGDPSAVTIFGESAGAISVGLHLFSPLSAPLFSRAILQSGSPFMRDVVRSQADTISISQDLARSAGCPAQPVQALISCMRRQDAGSVTDAQWAVGKRVRPVVDGVFLPDFPRSLLNSGRVKNTEVLIGANKNEGMYFLAYSFPELFPYNVSREPKELSLAQLKEVMGSVVHEEVGRVDESTRRKLVDAVIAEYWSSVVPSRRDTFRVVADQFKGDKMFTCSVVDFAKEYGARSANATVYLYSFEHALSSNPWPAWMGAMHGYEVEVVFGLPDNSFYRHHNYTVAEQELSGRMSRLWAQFAQTGNPNPTDRRKSWPRMTSQGLEYIVFTDRRERVEHGLRHHQCNFHKEIIPLFEQEETTQASGHEPTAVFVHFIIACPVLTLLLLRML